MAENWNVKQLLDWSTTYFQDHQIESPKLTGQLLLSHVLKCRRLDLFLHFDQPLSSEELAEYKALLIRRLEHEPVAYILGNAQFMEYEFTVSSAVLIPRPETEELVDMVSRHLLASKPHKVLDVGTGSGVIAICLKLKDPRHQVLACDISGEAHKIAQQNASKLQAHVEWLDGSFPDCAQSVSGHLTLVSNPPYIKTAALADLEPEVKDFEPVTALDGGGDGLDMIRCLMDFVSNYTSPISWFFEIGYDQEAAVMELANQKELKDFKVITDLSGNPRFFIGSKHVD